MSTMGYTSERRLREAVLVPAPRVTRHISNQAQVKAKEKTRRRTP